MDQSGWWCILWINASDSCGIHCNEHCGSSGFDAGIVGGLLAKAGTSVFLPEDQWISSGFFGALIAGFVAGYLMLLLKKVFERLPHALEGTKPVLLYPFFGILLMGAIMVFIVNPPVGAF